ncbi:DUF2487 family protein [Paenibacillus sp.]|uniref:DUF2487 family protein n=1 Tax=Paenibacillus sp. TaxID=58172 RepID=UPI00281203CC|nr:DUF2487 family protein [Paenibacillus sp.]
MKFSEIERERWAELQPYLDTALLPLSGLTGKESPHEATAALERLRDALDPIEQAYRGRVVTYPALHYAADDESLAALADELCERLKRSGFRYCVVVTGESRLRSLTVRNASAVLGPEPESQEAPSELYRSFAKRTIEGMWSGADA